MRDARTALAGLGDKHLRVRRRHDGGSRRLLPRWNRSHLGDRGRRRRVDRRRRRFGDCFAVYLPPFGRLVYTMPPYISSDQDLHTITTAIHHTLAAATC